MRAMDELVVITSLLDGMIWNDLARMYVQHRVSF